MLPSNLAAKPRAHCVALNAPPEYLYVSISPSLSVIDRTPGPVTTSGNNSLHISGIALPIRRGLQRLVTSSNGRRISELASISGFGPAIANACADTQIIREPSFN